MSKDTKETIQYLSATSMLAAGMALTYIGFFTPPVGEISDGVLWVLGQVLLFAGAIFGVANYVNYQIDKRLGNNQ